MSKCMTIADETVDQKDTCTEITPKDIVDFILEEALLSAFIASDKGCSRIGDFNITEDFRQPHDHLPHLKDFEQVDNSQNQSTENQESNLDSGKNVDRPAKESLELIIDSYVKIEEKHKLQSECTVVSAEVLANNELQIKDGKIRLGRTEENSNILESEKEKSDRDSVVTNEKLEIEYFNEGKMNKIYVPLNPVSSLHVDWVPVSKRREQEDTDERNKEEAVRDSEVSERPFEPFATEELRQVWGNGSPSVAGKWEGDVLTQREEAVRLMEELSSVHVFPDSSADPNRPRACSFAEEDVKKMIKEIEEISFTQCHASSEDLESVYHSDGQGDADLESKSSKKSKENFIKSQKLQKNQEESSSSDQDMKTKNELQKDQDEDLNLVEKEISYIVIPNPLKNSSAQITQNGTETEIGYSADSKSPVEIINGEHSLQYKVLPGCQEQGLKSPEKDSTSSYTIISKSQKGIAEETVAKYTENEVGYLADLKLPVETVNNERNSQNKRSASDWSTTGNAMQAESSQEQVLDMSLNIDLPSERMQAVDSSLSYGSFSATENDLQNELLLLTAGNMKRFSNHRSACEEFSPETISLSGNTGSLNGNKQDDFLMKNSEVTSELDVRTYLEKQCDGAKGTRSLNDTQEMSPALSFQIQRDTNSRGNLNGLSADSAFENKDLQLLSMGNNDGPEIDCSYQGSSSSLEMPKIGQHSTPASQNFNERLEEALNLKEAKVHYAERGQEMVEESLAIADDDQGEPYNPVDNNAEKEPTPTPPSTSQSQISAGSHDQSDLTKDSEVQDASTHKFKLHSQKMYWGPNHDLPNELPNKFTLTQSEEAFIDAVESVIQIIEPSDHLTEEDSCEISFSLLSDNVKEKPSSGNSAPDPELAQEQSESSEVEHQTKIVHSGMTTIGPMKNVDYDPKDLMAPEIEFGKMTRITSSKHLTKDMGLFGLEVSSIKIVEEDDSEDDESLNTDESRVEHTSLINRDIASLTKVQKIREVMSYQPKPEEDFEDEEILSRPRLDLKDVESMTDERYKVPDTNIPLLSLELGETNLGAEKDLIDSLGLVISGLTNPVYFSEDSEGNDTETEENSRDSSKIMPSQFSVDDTNNKESSKSLGKTEEETSVANLENKSKFDEETEPESAERNSNRDTECKGVGSNPKSHTLGTVFRKASAKLLRMDGDLFVRSSKSLPRDTCRLGATESIRSIIDECHSSASNMLKKSRSLLKNTQSIFKSISQSKVNSEPDSSNEQQQKKLSESNVSTIERKFSGFLKKEDLKKAKNLIKDKVEKTFKNFESKSSSADVPEISRGGNDLRVALRNTGNLQVDRMENFKKFLPKSPLVYKSQFVKSQMDVQSSLPEYRGVASDSGAADTQVVELKEKNPFVSDDNDSVAEKVQATFSESQQRVVTEKGVSFDEELQWIASGENLEPVELEDVLEPQQPDFIVMATVPGLPDTDLESPSSEKENLNVGNTGKKETEKRGKDLKKMEASNSLQIISEASHDIAPRFSQADEEKMGTKAPSERKIKTKKKFTARFRNFWCSAFGRVKTPPAKGGLP